MEGFTKKYNLNKLVYYEITTDVKVAIEREKILKKSARKKKEELIERLNPKWERLNETL